MKLAEKGRFAPPPVLSKAAPQRVSETLASWNGVHARTHWLLGDEREIDGADFYLGEEELGHIHLDGQAHVFSTRALAAALVGAGLARKFPWGRNIVMFDIATKADVEHGLWLFQLGYDRLHGTPESELLERVRQRRAA